MNDRSKSNTHAEESQNIDDNINDDNLIKYVIGDNMTYISKYNLYPEESQDVDDDMNYDRKKKISEVDVYTNGNEHVNTRVNSRSGSVS